MRVSTDCTAKSEDKCSHTSDGEHVHIGGKLRSPECNLCRYHQNKEIRCTLTRPSRHPRTGTG